MRAMHALLVVLVHNRSNAFAAFSRTVSAPIKLGQRAAGSARGLCRRGAAHHAIAPRGCWRSPTYFMMRALGARSLAVSNCVPRSPDQAWSTVEYGTSVHRAQNNTKYKYGNDGTTRPPG